MKFEEAGADRKKGPGLDASKGAPAAPTKKKKTKSHTAKKADRAPCPAEIQAVIDAFAPNAPPFDRRDFVIKNAYDEDTGEGRVLDQIQYFVDLTDFCRPRVMLQEAPRGGQVLGVEKNGIRFQRTARALGGQYAHAECDRGAHASQMRAERPRPIFISYHQIFRVKWKNGHVKYAPLNNIRIAHWYWKQDLQREVERGWQVPIAAGLPPAARARPRVWAQLAKAEVKKQLRLAAPAPASKPTLAALQVCKELMAKIGEI